MSTRIRSMYTIGIIAGLLITLYLPILLYSPPWGKSGYYTYVSNDQDIPYQSTFAHFDNEGSYLSFKSADTGNTITEYEYSFIYDNFLNCWHGTFPSKKHGDHFKLELFLKDDGSLLKVETPYNAAMQENGRLFRATYHKEQNPLRVLIYFIADVSGIYL